MIVKMTNKTISRLLEEEEIIEFQIIEMPYKEYLVNIETPNKKNISTITKDWRELINITSQF